MAKIETVINLKIGFWLCQVVLTKRIHSDGKQKQDWTQFEMIFILPTVFHIPNTSNSSKHLRVLVDSK